VTATIEHTSATFQQNVKSSKLPDGKLLGARVGAQV